MPRRFRIRARKWQNRRARKVIQQYVHFPAPSSPKPTPRASTPGGQHEEERARCTRRVYEHGNDSGIPNPVSKVAHSKSSKRYSPIRTFPMHPPKPARGWSGRCPQSEHPCDISPFAVAAAPTSQHACLQWGLDWTARRERLPWRCLLAIDWRSFPSGRHMLTTSEGELVREGKDMRQDPQGDLRQRVGCLPAVPRGSQWNGRVRERECVFFLG